MGLRYLRSPLNYIGGKYRILNQILPRFPNDIDTFVDLFCGGMNVSINVNAPHILANDKLAPIVDMYQYFKETSIDDILSYIEKTIKEYQLSIGNKDSYLRLRDVYNEKKFPLDLFLLICFSFNHQIRFNQSGDFNTSFGLNRSNWNSEIRKNLISMVSSIKEKNIVFSCSDFRYFSFKDDMFVYCDPPYSLTTGSYNDGNRGYVSWYEKDDMDLCSLLDDLDSSGIKFAMSNVISHSGIDNNIINRWSKKYNVIPIDISYNNCNYHLKDRESKSEEVLIVNYETLSNVVYKKHKLFKLV